MGLRAIALSGLDRAQSEFAEAASRLTRATITGALPVDTVDLSAAVVGLLAARQNFAINAKLVQAADRIERRTLDILA